MRYRVHVSRADYFALLLPFVEGAVKSFNHHGRVTWTYCGWRGLLHQMFLYLALIAPLLLYLRFRYRYAELTPAEMEYGSFWRKRTRHYRQIKRIVRGAISLDKAGGGLTQIYGRGMKRLDLRVEETAKSIPELTQYAPQASLEGME